MAIPSALRVQDTAYETQSTLFKEFQSDLKRAWRSNLDSPAPSWLPVLFPANSQTLFDCNHRLQESASVLVLAILAPLWGRLHLPLLHHPLQLLSQSAIGLGIVALYVYKKHANLEEEDDDDDDDDDHCRFSVHTACLWREMLSGPVI